MTLPGTCSQEAVDAIRRQVGDAMADGHRSLAVVVLPGSLNPVHCEHVSSLERAKRHLEQRGVAVVAGFLQPSSDEYVKCKLGPEWTMSLEDRIMACQMAAQGNGAENNGIVWIHAWESGQENGFCVPRAVQQFLENAVLGLDAYDVDGKSAASITAYMVCGADLVRRCGGWGNDAPAPMVVLQRPGETLPTSDPSAGWEVADGDMKPVSSTLIRDAIAGGQWDQLVTHGCDARVVEFMSARHKVGTLFVGQRRGPPIPASLWERITSRLRAV